jgi:hypothetical protein
VNAPEQTEEPKRELTNADVKGDPLFQKVAAELAELKTQIAAEKTAQQKAAEAAEVERLKEAGKYEEAIKMHTAKLEQMEAQHKADLLRRDLTTELVKAGAKNDVFLKGAIAAYDGESTIAEYVQSLTDSDEHKPFFGSLEQSRQTQPSPRAAAPNGNTQKTWEQVKAMEKSTDPKQRLEAADIIGEYMMANNGELPPGLE